MRHKAGHITLQEAAEALQVDCPSKKGEKPGSLAKALQRNTLRPSDIHARCWEIQKTFNGHPFGKVNEADVGRQAEALGVITHIGQIKRSTDWTSYSDNSYCRLKTSYRPAFKQLLLSDRARCNRTSSIADAMRKFKHLALAFGSRCAITKTSVKVELIGLRRQICFRS